MVGGLFKEVEFVETSQNIDLSDYKIFDIEIFILKAVCRLWQMII